MSMTGQLFATRIAVGLAVPSPQALQKTGSLLARGIRGMVAQAQQAGKSGGTGLVKNKYLTDLQAINQGTVRAQTRMNNEMHALLKQNLAQMDHTAGSQLGKSFDRTSKAFNSLKMTMAAPLQTQLSKGMDGLSGISAMTQQTQNLYDMGARNRRDVLAHAAQKVELQEKAINSLTEEASLIDTSTKQGARKSNRLVKDIGTKQKELALDKEILDNLKRQAREADKMDKLSAQLLLKQRAISRAILSTTDAIRNKFNESLRNSVMLLTAVGFKLSQNTQELMEFERELLNANSVFNLTNDSLFTVGNSIIEFGNEFGIATQNGATGLYQLASAGLSANEALEVLPHTLKLSMAVQGDHNTISKLTAQTLFGFGMEMDQAALITDKFAFAIQKSLIEYQDLSSAVKFALPFFTCTGQSIDQLLGALQILTNRALEAGIAGRGLRQALAEFAESAMDAEVGFRKMGVEILNAEGEMMQLTEIAAQFAAAVGPETASNTELLTTLIQDLNVRGATAFIHLVQASDEFTQAVEDTRNAGGQLDDMVRIQNESLTAQIQILKTNIFSIFAFRDAAFEGTEFINGFHKAVVDMVGGFKDLIIEGEGAEQQLTSFGQKIQDFAVGAVEGFDEVLQDLIKNAQELMDTGFFTAENFRLLTIPLRLMADILDFMANTTVPIFNRSLFEFYMYWKALSMLGIPALLTAMSGGLITAAGAMLGTSTTAGAVSAIVGRAGIGGLSTMSVGALKWGSRAALGATGIGTALLAYEALKFVDSKGYADIPGMAAGGYMNRANGGPVMVGEQGPELFMPGQAGQVLNNAETNNILGNDVVMRNVTIGIDSFGGIV
tara:strand:+ start:422 stop:2938 length:2517 start_codon:yes stop_codon:yes gene_type:complete